jgi:hypothetical protein
MQSPPIMIQNLQAFASSGSFKFHPYFGRPLQQCKSKMQEIIIHFLISEQTIFHDSFLEEWNLKFLHTSSGIFV